MGDHPLYDVTVELTADGKPVDRQVKRIGLRTVALDAKSVDHALRLVVNGRPVFAKGADWIPSDMFPTRVTADRLHGLVADAAAANMNMIRCWGGGYYEEDDFLQHLRRTRPDGVVRFQVRLQRPTPPAIPAFMDNVKARVRATICSRLRHHPSVSRCGRATTKSGSDRRALRHTR